MLNLDLQKRAPSCKTLGVMFKMTDRILKINNLTRLSTPRSDKRIVNNLLKHLLTKYPTAVKNFDSTSDKKDNFNILIDFITTFGVSMACGKTNAINPNFKGTFFYKIYMENKVIAKLKRTSNCFAYYGIKSLNNAHEKGIEKCFQIIEHILMDKELLDTTKRR